jgi:hypothetical protein
MFTLVAFYLLKMRLRILISSLLPQIWIARVTCKQRTYNMESSLAGIIQNLCKHMVNILKTLQLHSSLYEMLSDKC